MTSNETRALTTQEELAQLEIEIPALQQQIDAKRQRYTYLIKLQAGLVLSAEETQRIQQEFNAAARRSEEVWLASQEATRAEAELDRQRQAEQLRRRKERQAAEFERIEQMNRSYLR